MSNDNDDVIPLEDLKRLEDLYKGTGNAGLMSYAYSNNKLTDLEEELVDYSLDMLKNSPEEVDESVDREVSIPKALLKPFNPKSNCQKCGHKDANSEYHDGVIKFFGFTLLKGEEKILRTCNRCKFEWHEAVIENSVYENDLVAQSNNQLTDIQNIIDKELKIPERTKRYLINNLHGISANINMLGDSLR